MKKDQRVKTGKKEQQWNKTKLKCPECGESSNQLTVEVPLNRCLCRHCFSEFQVAPRETIYNRRLKPRRFGDWPVSFMKKRKD